MESRVVPSPPTDHVEAACILNPSLAAGWSSRGPSLCLPLSPAGLPSTKEHDGTCHLPSVPPTSSLVPWDHLLPGGNSTVFMAVSWGPSFSRDPTGGGNHWPERLGVEWWEQAAGKKVPESTTLPVGLRVLSHFSRVRPLRPCRL